MTGSCDQTVLWFVTEFASPLHKTKASFLLQSVHDDQSSRNYRKLEHLISYVVQPYLSSTGLRSKPSKPTKPSESSEEPSSASEIVSPSSHKPRPVSVGSLELQSKYSADRLHETALQSVQTRRFTFNESIAESSGSCVFGSSSSTVI